MEILYQNSCFSTVKRLHNVELLAECFLLSTNFEAVGRLKVDLKSFQIKEARWDIYRSPGGHLNGGRDLAELKGLEAYFNAGGDLSRIAGGEGGGLPRELLAECVRGIIQSETYVFAERGHPTARAYEEFWEKLYLNSCRYYSNLDRVTLRWFDYIGSHTREKNLFNRYKNCIVYKQPGGSLTATGSFGDSFHELGVHVAFTGEGVMAACTGNFLRAPDQVCFENVERLSLLTGKNIVKMGKKDLAAYVGGPQGCYHLVDIVHDISKSVAAALKMKI